MESATFKDYFSDAATAYAAFRPRYPGELASFLAGLCQTRRQVWDCGCGSGQLSVLLANFFETVVATDASARQISEAQPHARVEYRCVSAEDSGLERHSADLITVAQAVHWFDLSRFYDEVRRVGRPGAVLALIAYGMLEVEGLETLLGDFYGRVLEAYWPPERRHVETGYQLLEFPFTPLPDPGLYMSETWNLSALSGYIGTWSAVRALEQAQGPAPFQTFGQALGQAWGDPASLRTVRWPLTVRAGRLPSG
ncbi:MAG: class I SAM-dependent methyltransferase [Betaproteobacteria bacterium]|nr:class I SAM-dependent methyltransferase [Betaproteobacteria bacterium]MDE2623569.1 class I SAM-dependent methyltransferase [Betaproteobacteria bacterium]